MSDARTGVLHEEHALLGASFEPSETTGLLAVRSYAREAACAPAAGEARLTDLTGATYLLVSGSDAEPLAYAAFAGAPLPVGECAFSATLSGDGSLLSMPLVARCGDTEFVVIDPSPRGEALAAWTGLLARAESDGVRAFPLVSICDASEMLVPLALCGPAAEHVLSDYLHDASLPAPGQVRQLRLDAIDARARQIRDGAGDASIKNLEAWLRRAAEDGDTDTEAYRTRSALLATQTQRLGALDALYDQTEATLPVRLLEPAAVADSLARIGGEVGPTVDVADVNRDLLATLRDFFQAWKTRAANRPDTVQGIADTSGFATFG